MKTVVITGSSDGIGRETARVLLAEGGHHVVLHARSLERGMPVLETMRAMSPDVDLVVGDFTNLAQVRSLAADLSARFPRIDVLVNNAGVGSATPRELTADGHDVTWQVNYLAPFLLTKLVLPTLGRMNSARIVNVSSIGHEMGRIHFDDIELTHATYPRIEAYCQSKLAMIMWSYDLAEEVAGSGITVTAIHPGTYVDTKIVRAVGTPMTSLADGAASLLHQVRDDLGGVTGVYFDMQRLTRSSAASYERLQRDRLRRLTLTTLERYAG